jgi:hypothetical protein
MEEKPREDAELRDADGKPLHPDYRRCRYCGNQAKPGLPRGVFNYGCSCMNAWI